jgi:hypothetical protein
MTSLPARLQLGVRGLHRVASPFRRQLRPATLYVTFEGFAEVAARALWTHLEMRRFHAIRSELLEACWDARSGHAPCGETVPLDWGLCSSGGRNTELAVLYSTEIILPVLYCIGISIL